MSGQRKKNLFGMEPRMKAVILMGKNNVGENTGKRKCFLCVCVLGIRQILAECHSVGWPVFVLGSARCKFSTFSRLCLIDILM